LIDKLIKKMNESPSFPDGEDLDHLAILPNKFAESENTIDFMNRVLDRPTEASADDLALFASRVRIESMTEEDRAKWATALDIGKVQEKQHGR
jgi:hypothetical protein